MYCSKCGMQNSEEAIQCINCGSPLAAAEVRFSNPQTSGLAVASLVMAVLSLFCSFFLAIPSIICGILALSRIKGAGGRLKGTGLATAGITVSCILMLVVPVLLAILMPALARVKHIAARVVCGTNLKGLSTAMVVYMNDYDDKYPTSDQWCDLLMQEADVAPQSFQCPESDAEYAYAINENLEELDISSVREPTKVVVLFEADLGKNGVGDREDVVLRHDQTGQAGCNIAFADGHVEFVTEDRLNDLIWTAE